MPDKCHFTKKLFLCVSEVSSFPTWKSRSNEISNFGCVHFAKPVDYVTFFVVFTNIFQANGHSSYLFVLNYLLKTSFFYVYLKILPSSL